MERVYILSAICLKERTENELRSEFASIQPLHKGWLSKTFEDYKKYIGEWHEDQYQVSSYDTAYFTSYEEAMQAAKENRCDINEAGSYPYLLIRSLPMGAMYADAEGDDYTLLLYDKEAGEYKELAWEDGDEVDLEVKKVIMKNFDGMPSAWDRVKPSKHGWNWPE